MAVALMLHWAAQITSILSSCGVPGAGLALGRRRPVPSGVSAEVLSRSIVTLCGPGLAVIAECRPEHLMKTAE